MKNFGPFGFPFYILGLGRCVLFGIMGVGGASGGQTLKKWGVIRFLIFIQVKNESNTLKYIVRSG